MSNDHQITTADSEQTDLERSVIQLRQEGWCVVEDVIPSTSVESIRKEVEDSAQVYEEYAKEHDRWGRNVISFMPGFAAYLAQPKLMELVKLMLGPEVHISQTEYKIRPPHHEMVRGYHSDFPFDLNQKWHVKQPFPTAVLGLTTLWMLVRFATENGGTWIVPRTHLDTRNPRGKGDRIDERAPIPGEIQATGPAGSVLVMDPRVWHSNAASPSDHPRTAVVVRYAPWWLNLELHGVNTATIPGEVFDTFPDEVKVLYEHRAQDRENKVWV